MIKVTRVNITIRTTAFYNVGGGLILKSTIRHILMVHYIELNRFIFSKWKISNDICIGYHLAMIDDNNDDETALLMPFHVAPIKSMKNVLTAKNNSEMLNVKDKIPGFIYFLTRTSKRFITRTRKSTSV